MAKQTTKPSYKTQSDYEVGYGKPPEEHRFKPGESGNRNGRPKGSKNLRTEVQEAMNDKIEIRVNGKTKKVSKQTAMVARLIEKGLKGEIRAIDKALALAEKYNNHEIAEVIEDTLGDDDAQILERALERRQKNDPTAKDDPDDTGEAA